MKASTEISSLIQHSVIIWAKNSNILTWKIQKFFHCVLRVSHNFSISFLWCKNFLSKGLNLYVKNEKLSLMMVRTRTNELTTNPYFFSPYKLHFLSHIISFDHFLKNLILSQLKSLANAFEFPIFAISILNLLYYFFHHHCFTL